MNELRRLGFRAVSGQWSTTAPMSVDTIEIESNTSDLSNRIEQVLKPIVSAFNPTIKIENSGEVSDQAHDALIFIHG